MKLKEICLLKEGDIVMVGNKRKTVKEKAKDETIKVGNTYRYYSEIQTPEEYEYKAKHNNYKMYDFTNK